MNATKTAILPPQTRDEKKLFQFACNRYPVLPWNSEAAEDFGIQEDLSAERVHELVELAGRVTRKKSANRLTR